MEHWTSHAFHASVVSPQLMYGDVTVGFADGFVTFSGRPIRSWRVWSWVSRLARFLVLVTGAVVIAPNVLAVYTERTVTGPLAITLGLTIAACVAAMLIVGGIVTRVSSVARDRVAERVAKLPVAEVADARLSGNTLSLRAPFDPANRSNRWRMHLDSHEQGESLMALLGRL